MGQSSKHASLLPWIHPLALAAALNLDFLCIHPFRGSNADRDGSLWFTRPLAMLSIPG